MLSLTLSLNYDAAFLPLKERPQDKIIYRPKFSTDWLRLSFWMILLHLIFWHLKCWLVNDIPSLPIARTIHFNALQSNLYAQINPVSKEDVFKVYCKNQIVGRNLRIVAQWWSCHLTFHVIWHFMSLSIKNLKTFKKSENFSKI